MSQKENPMGEYKKSEETKDKILQTASRLFYEQGYEATTVREIAAQSGVSFSRINYHFQNKAELAGIICREFLMRFNDEVTKKIEPMIEGNKILRDSTHIRLWGMIFLEDNQPRRFYYEMICENILEKNLIDSDYNHFKEQARHLKLDVSDRILRSYARIFVASMLTLVKGRVENDLDMTLSEILDEYNKLHLKILDVDEPRRSEIIAQAGEITSNLTFEIPNMADIRLVYRNNNK